MLTRRRSPVAATKIGGYGASLCGFRLGEVEVVAEHGGRTLSGWQQVQLGPQGVACRELLDPIRYGDLRQDVGGTLVERSDGAARRWPS